MKLIEVTKAFETEEDCPSLTVTKSPLHSLARSQHFNHKF